LQTPGIKAGIPQSSPQRRGNSMSRPAKEKKMFRICGRSTVALVAGGLLLSLVSAADASQCDGAKVGSHEPKYSACWLVRPKTERPNHSWSVIGQPQQDPRDAWQGYFANPFDNPDYHGSNGG
jgi:hypothetical protein